MNNNEPDTLPDPAIGYIFQNDIVALKQAFSLPDIDYADISQREQLAAALKRWPLLAEFAPTSVKGIFRVLTSLVSWVVSFIPRRPERSETAQPSDQALAQQ
ncbi:TPA: hypothetical protein JLF89_003695 [Escherichia coli]|nr:hypothetical protein [Escherichia coli]